VSLASELVGTLLPSVAIGVGSFLSAVLKPSPLVGLAPLRLSFPQAVGVGSSILTACSTPFWTSRPELASYTRWLGCVGGLPCLSTTVMCRQPGSLDAGVGNKPGDDKDALAKMAGTHIRRR